MKTQQTDMNTQKKLLGQRLRAARLAINASQDFAAQSLGVTRQSVSAWENGTTCPSAIQLANMASLYCVSAHELLFGETYQSVDVMTLMRHRVAATSG